MAITVPSNPLSELDQATYHLTLFLVPPETWNDPVGTLGRTGGNITHSMSKGIVIAESGVTDGFSIDNVLMLTSMSASPSQGNAQTAQIQFDLMEPLGFSLMDRILSMSGTYNFTTMMTARFVLKLEFMGRDTQTSRSRLVPDATYYYPLLLNRVSGKLGPEGSVYNIVAMNNPKATLTDAVIEADIKVPGITNVGSFASALESQLAKYEEEIRRIGDAPGPPSKKTWKIEFSERANDFGLYKMPMASTDDLSKAAGDATSEDTDKVDAQATPKTNVVAYITEMITRNVSKLGEVIKIYKDMGDSPVPTVVVIPTTTIKKGRDEATNTPEREVKLTIDVTWSWATPNSDPEKHQSNLSNEGKQQGRFNRLPIKKVYDYLYTGKNTEVINFEMDFEALFTVARDPYYGYNYDEATDKYIPSVANKQTEAETAQTDNLDALLAEAIQQDLANTNRSNAFLSDFKLDPDGNFLPEMPMYEYISMDAQKQRALQSKNVVDSYRSVREKELATRTMDSLVLDLDIVGDPFWLGIPGEASFEDVRFRFGTTGDNHMVAFRIHDPDPSMASPDASRRNEMNLIVSGVYNIISVESRFQAGKFVQSLNGYRDTNTSAYYTQDQLKSIRATNSKVNRNVP